MTTAGSDVEDLYRREATALLGMMVAFLGDRAWAEDVVQEAFARVHRTLPNVDPAKTGAYLRTTAFNLARSGLRRQVVARRFRPERAHATGADDRVLLHDDQRAVITAVRGLPVRQRECVVLRYYAELGDREIADTLGISANSVKTHLRRGLARLAHELEDRR